MTTATRLTADELLAMPDEGRGFELIDGELREKTVSQESSCIGGTVHAILHQHILPRKLGVLFPCDTGFQCFETPDSIRKPDVAFIRREKITREAFTAPGYCKVVPDLVIEVLSPSETNETIHDKREQWMDAGVRVFWIVDPRDETVRVYEPGQKPRLFTTLDSINIESLLPGFAFAVSEFFLPPALADS